MKNPAASAAKSVIPDLLVGREPEERRTRGVAVIIAKVLGLS